MTTDTLKARRQELLNTMPNPANVMRASLITRSIKCGKPNCRCANGEGHKSLYLSSYYNGKTRLDSRGQAYKDAVSQCIKDYEDIHIPAYRAQQHQPGTVPAQRDRPLA